MTFEQRAHRAAESVRRAAADARPRAAQWIAWERRRAIAGRAAVAAAVIAAFALGIAATRLWTSTARVRPGARPIVTQRLLHAGVTTSMAATSDAIWLGTVAPAGVVRLDPSEERVIALASLPEGAHVVAVEANRASAWAIGLGRDTRSSRVVPVAYRLDPATASVLARIELPATPLAAALGDGTLWVSDDRNVVARIDPRSGRVLEEIDVGIRPAALEYDPARRAVWVVNTGQSLNLGSRDVGGSLLRIDVDTNAVTAAIPVGRRPGALAVDADVWVANAADATVSRIDPDTDRVVATIPVGAAPRGLIAHPRTLWVVNVGDGTVSLIDVRSGRVTATIPVGRPTGAVAPAVRGLWVARDGEIAKLGVAE